MINVTTPLLTLTHSQKGLPGPLSDIISCIYSLFLKEKVFIEKNYNSPKRLV